jgi:hypothetical protein
MIALMVLGILSCFFPVERVFSAPQMKPFTCSACHDDGAGILPSSHKNHDIRNTASCVGCHFLNGKAKPLGEKIHLVHVRKGVDTIKNCHSCHEATTGGEVAFPQWSMKVSAERMEKLKALVISSMTSTYLDHRHQGKGVSCMACHAKPDYIEGRKEVDTQPQCVKCHGDYPAMIAKTAKSRYDKNPHKSHLPDVPCSACHHGHQAFEDICSPCHAFGYKASQGK